MNSRLTELINRQSPQLGALIEPGLGFLIGSPEWKFVLAEQGRQRWVHTDQEHGLKVYSQADLIGSALVISRCLENTSDRLSEPIDLIEPLRLLFHQPCEDWRHIYASGGTTEGHYPPQAWRTQDCSLLSRGRNLTIESHPQGRSSNLHFPILVSLISTEPKSPGLFCGLEWSANWYMKFEKPRDTDSASLTAGIKVNALLLDPGEVLDLPPVHLGFFTGGPDGATNTLRKYIYENVCARYRGRPPVPIPHYNHFYGIGNNLNFQMMKAQAARAAELGLEVFVVDAGWFPGGFPLGVGNWDLVDKQKFPDGLEPLAEYVRSLGMGFGLWFDIERAYEGTSAHRQHPELFVPVDKRNPKHQFYHLNLADPRAQDYVIETVGGWIKRLDLRWSRWDYNIDPQSFWHRVDPTGKIQFRYMQGFYRVLDTLMADHPKWMLECCASGGRRIDIGTIKRAHTCWISDASRDHCISRYQQARANRFLPGHLLNSCMPTNEKQGDAGLDDTTILSRMLGTLEITGEISGWSERLTARMARWVAEFKALRHLLVQDFYQLLPTPATAEDWDAVQFVSYSGDQAAIFAFAGSAGGRRSLIPKGLKPDAQYILSRRPDGQDNRSTGKELLSSGITADLHPGQAGLWLIRLADS